MSTVNGVQLRLLAAGAAMITMLAGACGNNGAGQGAAGEVDGSTIVLQTVTGLEPNFKKYAEAYMEEFPDRKVEVRATTDDGAEYAQQLATARISGELPDLLFNVDYLADTLATNNVTLDLTEGMADGKLGGLTQDDFLPQFLGQYRPLGDQEQITGLPVSADSVALFYNRTAFQKAGVSEYPEANWTWDDMYRVAEEVQSKSGGDVVGISAPLGNGSSQITFGPVLKAFGAMYYDPETHTTDIGSPEAIEAWELLISFYGTASSEYSASPTPDPSLKFESGNVAMGIATSANVPAFRSGMEGQDWDVVPLPTINGKSTAGGGSYGLSISQTSQNQDAAWAFLSWFYDSDRGMKLAQEIANVIPPTNDGIDNGTWREVTPPKNIASFADSARSAILLQQFPGTAGSVLTEATTKATQQVVLEGRTVEEAFKEAEDTVNATLEKEKPE